MAKNDIQVKRNDNRNDDRNFLSSQTPFQTSFGDMNRLMERFFSDPFGSLLSELPAVSRRVDVKETDDGFFLFAEVPGIPQEDIEINVNGNMLTIHAEHREEQGEADSESGYRREYRSFHQNFALPTTVNANEIQAHCDHGMLEVFMPKNAMSQAKKVEVQSGKGGLWSRLTGKKDVGQAAPKKEKH